MNHRHRTITAILGLLAALVLVPLSPAVGAGSQVVLIPENGWRFNADNKDLGAGWRSMGFDDSTWSQSKGVVGAQEAGLDTTISNLPPTVYFRGTFTLDRLDGLSDLRFNWQRDDGAVVYLNGTEVHRSNMPSGNAGYAVRASSIDNWDGRRQLSTPLPASLLQQGTNVLAVSVHQAGNASWTSADMAFRGELQAVSSGAAAPTIAAPAGWKIAGGDEFSGSTIDRSRWGMYDPSWLTGEYGNADPNTVHCLTYDNVSVSGGSAVIKAKKERVSCDKGRQKDYTSGFLVSRESGTYYPLYGRYEIRARIPHGQGIWPAFWLRHIDGASAAEIDVLEVFHSSDPGSLTHTLHFPSSLGKNVSKTGVPFENAVKGTGGWHTFAVDIEQVHAGRDDVVRFVFWVDGKKTHEYTNTKASKWTSVSDKSRVWDVAINTAVGATYAGHPDQKLGWFAASGGRCALERPQAYTTNAGSCDDERTPGKWYNDDKRSAPARDGKADIWLAPWNYNSGATADYVIDYFRYYKRG